MGLTPEKAEEDDHCNACRRLLVAILNQAIEDVRFPLGRRPRKEESEHRKRKWVQRDIEKRLASWWIFGKYDGKEDFFTFDDVCSYLNLEPSLVRGKLLESGVKDQSDKVNVDFSM